MEEKFDFKKIFSDVENTIGEVNILVAGRTGAGKSTLINSVFQGNIAKTGVGKPVTQSTTRYTKKGVPVGIYDTRGLEMKDYEKIISELKEKLEELCSDQDPKKHIHCGWICIQEFGARYEDGELSLAAMFKALKIPYIVVITKCIGDKKDRTFYNEIKNAFPGAGQIVETLADKFNTANGTIHPFGLSTLVEATLEMIPEGQTNAFTTAQKVSKSQKKSTAKKIVAAAAISAALAGAVPIPVSDFIIISAIQLTMLATITRVYGFSVTETVLMTIIKGGIGSGLATMAGLGIVGSFLKLIPGFGTLAGGMITGFTAGAVTTALGLTYIKTVSMLSESSDPETVSADDIAKAFGKAIKNPVRNASEI